jgi:hypothetical protein
VRLDGGKALLVLTLVTAAYPLNGETPKAHDKVPPASSRIADALCGRTSHDPRAAALNESDLALVLKRWGGSRGADLRAWLTAPPCRAASAGELANWYRRRETLTRLQASLDHGAIADRFRMALKEFPKRTGGRDDWPEASVCLSCAELRKKVEIVEKIAACWPSTKPGDARIRSRIETTAQQMKLVREICTPELPRVVRREITTRYKYYTWTAEGSRLLAIAAWFKRPEVTAGCKSQ